MTELNLLQRSLYTIKKLKKLLAERPVNQYQPIAIIGLGCRLPGADDKNKFWDLLTAAQNVVTQFPAERWRLLERTGEIALKENNHPYWGAYLADIEKFDAYFFGITPREAEFMDPQQRILLETAYEAIQDAGMPLQKISKSNTGVFIGQYQSQYARLLKLHNDLDALYLPTGNAVSISANRLSYWLNLQGPSMVVDTACSSSLVAVHLACLHLQNELCDMAIAGGISINLLPSVNLLLSKAQMLSPDGQCKTFDNTANGYVQGEGAGIIILKTLDKAIQAGDRIYAIIAGGAINQDGKTNGLTAPNGVQQEAVLKSAYRSANLHPAEVSYVECHGTGTLLGDPIEVQALGNVIGKGRKIEQTCWIGSVKTNLGHLEPAAGIAGLIKVALALSNKKIPQHLNVNKPNEYINFDKFNLKIPQSLIDWPVYGKNRIAGVSGFGFGGTNAHIVLRDFTETEQQKKYFAVPAKKTADIFVLSARNSTALLTLIERWRQLLVEQPSLDFNQLCNNSQRCRTHYEERAAIIAGSMEELRNKLELLISAPEDAEQIIYRNNYEQNGKAVQLTFYFGDKFDEVNLKALYESFQDQPVFSKALHKCVVIYNNFAEHKIEAAFFNNQQAAKETPGLITNFIVTYALCALMASWNIKPSFMLVNGVLGQCLALIVANKMLLGEVLNYLYHLLYGKKNAAITKMPEDTLWQPSAPVLNLITGQLLATDDFYLVNDDSYNEKEHININNNAADFLQKNKITTLFSVTALSQSLTDFFEGPDLKILNLPAGQAAKVSQNPYLHLIAWLYLNGVNINWENLTPSVHYPRIDMPLYPWQHKTYWVNTSAPEQWEEARNNYPLSGKNIDAAIGVILYEFTIDARFIRELQDSYNIVHVGYYLDMVLFAVKQSFSQQHFSLMQIHFTSALIIKPNESVKVQLTLEPLAEKKYIFKFYSKSGDKSNWLQHIEGNLSLIAENVNYLASSVNAIKKRCVLSGDAAEFRERIQAMSMPCSGTLEWTANYWLGKNEILCEFAAKNVNDYGRLFTFQIHPGVVDGCIQPLFLALPENSDFPYLTTFIDNIRVTAAGKDKLYLYANLTYFASANLDKFTGDFCLFNEEGAIILQCQGIELKQIYSKALISSITQADETKRSGAFKNLMRRNKAEIIDYLTQVVAEICALPLQDIKADKPLIEMGVDSILALAIIRAIENEGVKQCTVQDILQGISIQELTRFFIDETLEFSTIQVQEFKQANTYLSLDKVRLNPWFAYRKLRPKAKIRVFCFPYGGGGASIYRDWDQYFSEDIEICPIQLPGRENRMMEACISRIELMLNELEHALIDELALPFVFFGHSFGALIAFELAGYLRSKNLPTPLHLFAAGYPDPRLPPTSLNNLLQKLNAANLNLFEMINNNAAANIEATKIQDFVALLNQSGLLDVNGQILDNKIIELILPILNADMNLVKNYTYKNRDPLNCPITVLIGKKDKWIPYADHFGWAMHTRKKFDFYEIEADHLFIKEAVFKKQVLAIINQLINKYVLMPEMVK